MLMFWWQIAKSPSCHHCVGPFVEVLGIIPDCLAILETRLSCHWAKIWLPLEGPNSRDWYQVFHGLKSDMKAWYLSAPHTTVDCPQSFLVDLIDITDWKSANFYKHMRWKGANIFTESEHPKRTLIEIGPEIVYNSDFRIISPVLSNLVYLTEKLTTRTPTQRIHASRVEGDHRRSGGKRVSLWRQHGVESYLMLRSIKH